MIFCKELNKNFSTVEDLFKALKENRNRIIELKKATVKNSDGLPLRMIEAKDSAIKSLDFMKDGFLYPVINTTNYLDSHSDVHIKGIWNKTLKEQQGKVFWLVNHDMKIGSVIAYPKDLEIIVEELAWSDLGRDYEGTTEALIFKTKISDYSNADAKAVIENKLPAENSVRMQYVKIEMAINSGEEGYKEEKAVFDKYIGQITNREQAEKQGYFWAVTEAKVYKEGSMVLLGSNDVTPILYNELEPSEDTPEPSKDTQKIAVQEINNFITQLKKS